MDQTGILQSFKESIDVAHDVLKTGWDENYSIEFKKSLHVRSDEIDKQYLTTISGLANNKGGIIVFGIENNTKEIVGIKPALEGLDNRYFSTAIRQGLDGNFNFFFFTGRFLTKIVGFLYVAEADVKPVIVRVSHGEIVRGEIYYRYPAQTTRIEAADLRRIIDEEVNKKLSSTINAFHKVIEIGAKNVAIINTENGEIEIDSVKSSTKLNITSESLKELNLIKEGRFVETEGAPAYVLKGEIEIELEESEEVMEKMIPTLTTESEIYRSFLSGVCEHPELMLEQTLLHQSHYAPVFFFAIKAGMNVVSTLEFIDKIDRKNIQKNTKKNLMVRIASPSLYQQGALSTIVKHYLPKTGSVEQLVKEIKSALGLTGKKLDLQIERTVFYNTITSLTPIPIELYDKHLTRIMEALSHVSVEFIIENKQFILDELSKAFDTPRDNNQNTLMRKVISNVDMALYYSPG